MPLVLQGGDAKPHRKMEFGLKVNSATRAGTPGAANMGLLWLGSAARKTVTPAGRGGSMVSVSACAPLLCLSQCSKE